MRQVIILTALVTVLAVGNVRDVYVPRNTVLSEPTPIEQFMDKIAEIETPGGGYQTVNRFGMLGRYQFNPKYLKPLGYNVSRTEFLKNPEIQDSVMVTNMRNNEKLLQHLIHRYDGRTVKGVRITRASILAGAHFAGPNGVKSFLVNESRTGIVDANGTSLKKYMSMFSNFHLPSLIG